MRVNYGICNNKDCYYGAMACDWSCKLYTCLKHSEKSIQKMKFYTCGQHNSNDITKSNRGISDQVKEIIDDLVSNYDHRPKRIHAKLQQILHTWENDGLEQFVAYFKKQWINK